MPEPSTQRYKELLYQIGIIENFLKHNLSKNPLIESREAAIDEFLGPNGQNIKEAADAYFACIKGIFPDGTLIDKELADEYTKRMDSLIMRSFLFSSYYSYSEAEVDREIDKCLDETEKVDDKEYTIEERQKDKEELEEERILRKKYLKLNDYIIEKLAEVFKHDNIDELSQEDMRVIDKQLMHIASYSKAMDYFTDFVELEKRMREANKPMSPNIRKRYVQTFLEDKTEYKNNGIEPPEAKQNILLQAENYFIDYACERLDEFDKKMSEAEDKTVAIDELWEDDTLNYIIQMKNKNRLGGQDELTEKCNKLDTRIQTIVKKYFTEQDVEEAKATMDSILGPDRHSNKNLRIDYIWMPSTLKQLEEAYKIVYLSELLSNNQAKKESTPSLDSIFIASQILYHNNLNQEANINADTLLKRVLQKIVEKELQTQIDQANEQGAKIDNPIVVGENFNAKSDATFGSLNPTEQVFEFSTEAAWILHNRPEELIHVIFHEIDHFIKIEKQKNHICSNYIDYLVMKSQIITNAEPVWRNYSYKTIFSEVMANCAGDIGIIRSVRQLPGSNSAIDRASREIFKLFELTDRNDMRSPMGRMRTVKIMDDIVARKEENKWGKNPENLALEILDFEYNKDGTPKTFEQLLEEQQREIDGEANNPEIGPDNIVDRTKFRMQIMMDRVLSSEDRSERDDEKFLKLLKKFVSKNHDVLKEDPFFDYFNKSNEVSNNTTTTINDYAHGLLFQGTEDALSNSFFAKKLGKVMEIFLFRYQVQNDIFGRAYSVWIGDDTKGPNKPDGQEGPDDQAPPF